MSLFYNERVYVFVCVCVFVNRSIWPKRDLHVCQKRPTHVSKECMFVNRSIWPTSFPQKKPKIRGKRIEEAGNRERVMS